jgi:hypothetical protein
MVLNIYFCLSISFQENRNDLSLKKFITKAMLEQTSLKVPQRPELPIYFFLEPERASL